MKFTFPMPVNLANSRLHWRVKHNLKKAYWEKCDGLQLVGFLPPPPDDPFERATATVRLYVHNLMDEGNAMARLKWIEDWLVTRGYLVDDRSRNLHYPEPAQQTIDRKDPRVEIEVRRA